jgi:NADPH:quinone reductase
MRAIRFENAGNADVIKLVEKPIPQVRPHDLLVRVYAAGLNRSDILQRQGFYGKQPDFGDSVIPGLEIAGEVVEVGTAATGFPNGDRVMAVVGGGAHAEYARRRLCPRKRLRAGRSQAQMRRTLISLAGYS